MHTVLTEITYGGIPLDLRPETRELAEALRRATEGEVRFDAGSRGLYATDASNYRQPPIGVVVPRTVDDVVATVAVCRERGVPLFARGGGTSLAGQCCNTAVVMDMTRHLNRVSWIDAERRLAAVQPGIVLDDLQAAAGEVGLTFGPDPSTHDRCTVGGMVGNNACGMHAQWAGRTAENVAELEVLTYRGDRFRVGPTSDAELDRIIRAGGAQGEIYAKLADLRDRYADQIRARFPDIPRRVSGFTLEKLLPEAGFDVAGALVGSESTCVTYLEVVTKLLPAPGHRTLVVFGFPDVFAAGDAVPIVNEHGPIALEGMDDLLVANMRLKALNVSHLVHLPDGHGWLLAEFAADTKEEAAEAAQAVARDLERRLHEAPSVAIFDDPADARRVWEIRESGLGATARVPTQDDHWPGWEDSAVHPDDVGRYLRDLRGLFERHGYTASLYGHFGHGCIHCRVDFDLRSGHGIGTFKRFLGEATDLVLSYGGSLSGEHGDGQARGELLERMYGPELVGAFREFKAIWDPDGAMNPGKVVNPDPVDANLRIGTGYRPAEPDLHFDLPDDSGSLARATLRCVGVGKCRREDSGTMCPSYMVTKEEAHSTRGRARLLDEMLRGEVVTDGWRSDAVKDALDLCLACKACKHECPVNVDMATYKAEFLSHYHRRRIRPRQAYAMGLISWWARLGGRAPRLVNALTGVGPLASVAKRSAGLTLERDIPTFSNPPLHRWFRDRASPGGGDRPEVVLWPDTFTNFFAADHGRAAVAVLERAGYKVVLPERIRCCGRPLYDFGMLTTAKRWLRAIVEDLRPHLEAGTPIVVLEPSCLSTFRDELVNFFPGRPDTMRMVSQAVSLGEFLVEWADVDLPRLEGRALLHLHCHHRSVLGVEEEIAVLEALGVDLEVLDSGCCGLAGSFGFEAGEKYDVSMAAGERVLLPAVRDASPSTAVVTDGFSCQTQIAHGTGRTAEHLATVVARAWGVAG